MCNKRLQGRQMLYCSSSCKNSRLQAYQIQRKRGCVRKAQLIQELGGGCRVCGYNKNSAALVFHHRKTGKVFKLDLRRLANASWDSLIDELKKCELLCVRCHAEGHHPDLLVEDLLKLER